MQLKFLEIKRFIFQLEEIVEFSKDDAADVATLIKLIEQCLGQKLYLNVDCLVVAKMRSMLEVVVGQVKKRLDVEGIDDPALDENQARVKQILRDDLAKDVHAKVKRLIRRYFEDLWREETGQKAARKPDAPTTAEKSDVERKGSEEQGEDEKEEGKTGYHGVETGLGQTLEGEDAVNDKR